MLKKYLPISKAAKLLEVSSDTLRRWEKIGKLKSFRSEKGQRCFLEEDIQTLKFGPNLTIKKAAALLQISPSTLRRLTNQGKIQSTTGLNKYRTYSIDEILRYKHHLENQNTVKTYSINDSISSSSHNTFEKPINEVSQISTQNINSDNTTHKSP